MKRKQLFIVITTFILGLTIGWILFSSPNTHLHNENEAQSMAAEQIWTCSMHPQIRQPNPGDCPICGMDLIPLELSSSESITDVKMSESAMKLATISTIVVGNNRSGKTILLYGRITENEKLTNTQSAHYNGRIEQLFVNSEGERVVKGQQIATIYSPDLMLAQEELLTAQKLSNSNSDLLKLAKNKLLNLRVSENQIQRILEKKSPINQFSITAEASGIISTIYKKQGDYIKSGMPIYAVADLSTVWIEFDVYEKDLKWLKKGSTIEIEIPAVSGKFLTKKIEFVDETINSSTNTAIIRTTVSNNDQQLKPQMVVLGNVTVESFGEKGISIPKSAVLWTGKRSLVYVKNQTDSEISFQKREVTLGNALGEEYYIISGLEIGEEIAQSGIFSIDAAAQLSGKQSMMNTKIETVSQPMRMASIDDFSYSEKEALKSVIDMYIDLKEALAADEDKDANKFAIQLIQTIKSININTFTKEHQKVLSISINKILKIEDLITEDLPIKELRQSFKRISEEMIHIASAYRVFEENLYIQYCPMADNNAGASWLSESSEIENPYFGSMMHKCGEVKTTLINN